MIMSNKGFSSKEYLLVIIAVFIVVLGVLPIIFRVIDKSRENVVTDNVMIFRQEINKEILSYINGGNEILDGCYIVTSDGNICLGETSDSGVCKDETLVIDISGMKPDGGSVSIQNNEVSSIYNIMIDNRYVNCKDNEYYISDKPEVEIVCIEK